MLKIIRSVGKMAEKNNIIIKQLNDNSKKRKKNIIKIITLLIIVIIIIAMVIDLFLAYLVAPLVKVSSQKVESFTPISTNDYEIDFVITMDNPTDSKILIEKITYNLFVEFQLVGRGEKTSFELSPGKTDQSFSVNIDINDLSIVIREQLLSSTVSIKIAGTMTIPIRLMRAIKIGEVTREYELLQDISASRAFL
jgi:LEA14-like dessication related protein